MYESVHWMIVFSSQSVFSGPGSEPRQHNFPFEKDWKSIEIILYFYFKQKEIAMSLVGQLRHTHLFLVAEDGRQWRDIR